MVSDFLGRERLPVILQAEHSECALVCLAMVLNFYGHRIDINTLHRVEGVDGLALNEIGRIRLRSTKPLFVDPYLSNRQTGAFILVDESTNRTVAAGMIVRESGS